jgi:hypothetical protein
MNWPFASRRARLAGALAEPAGSGDYSLFAKNDACIKLWLPEKLSGAIERVGVAYDMSRPDVLRWLLFEYIYGKEQLVQLAIWKKRHDGVLADVQARQGSLFSVEEEAATPYRCERMVNLDYFGKSVDDFKLWLPAPLKADLERHAADAQQGMSDYLRTILVRLLLGESMLRDWQNALDVVPRHVREAEAQPYF